MSDMHALEAQALALFELALDQPSTQREAWIMQETQENEQLRKSVFALLRADTSNDQAILTGAAVQDHFVDVTPPDAIGAYRIIEKLGQGGMGAVFKAQRNAGDFEHVVAIKIIKPGLLSEKLKPRFQTEQQILASFSHPNIARLYDGGQTEDGMPYIIMEYIKGEPLNDWVNKHNLSTDQRLALFIQACKAVAYAHQNLVIHRDLTPSNVLVTENGELKLIDFGIAKPFDSDASDNVQGSSTSNLSLTPGFAAPERAHGAPANVSLDIYSLGKLLLELIDEQYIDSELQAIIDKASNHQASLRYVSVNDLIADLTAYSNGYAVSASNGGNFYRFGKFVRRNRLLVGLSCFGLVALLAALGVTSYLYQQAEQARSIADKRFNDVRSLANTMMFTIYSEIDAVPGTLRAKQELAGAAQQYLNELSQHENATKSLQIETARGFIQLADIYGSPSMSNKGDFKQAKVNLAKAESIAQTYLASEHQDVASLSLLRDINFLKARNEYYVDNQADDANDYFEIALDYAEQALTLDPDSLDLQLGVLQIQMEIAINYRWDNQLSEAIALISDVIQQHESLLKTHSEHPKVLEELAKALRSKAEFLSSPDTAEQAVSIASRAIQIERIRGSDDPKGDLKQLRAMAFSHWRRASAYLFAKDYANAVTDYRQAIGFMNSILQRDPGNHDASRLLASYQGEAAMSLVQLGEYAQAESYMQGAKQYFKAKFDDDPSLGSAQRSMMVVYVQFSEFYKAWGKEEKRCESLANVVHYRNIMENDGNLNESDKAGIESYINSEAKCPQIDYE